MAKDVASYGAQILEVQRLLALISIICLYLGHDVSI